MEGLFEEPASYATPAMAGELSGIRSDVPARVAVLLRSRPIAEDSVAASRLDWPEA